jgi:hypothetical protein
VKFAYKVVDKETPSPLQQIDIQNDLDLLVASFDYDP